MLFRHTSLIGRLILMLAAFSAAAAGDDDDARRLRLLIRDMSRALQAGNAPLFLAAFDREKMPQFDRFQEQVRALLAQKTIASSVDIGGIDMSPATADRDETRVDEASVAVDWLLQLRPRREFGPIETRRETVSLGMTRKGAGWKISALSPAEFFEPIPPATPR